MNGDRTRYAELFRSKMYQDRERRDEKALMLIKSTVEGYFEFLNFIFAC